MPDKCVRNAFGQLAGPTGECQEDIRNEAYMDVFTAAWREQSGLELTDRIFCLHIVIIHLRFFGNPLCRITKSNPNWAVYGAGLAV